MNVSENDISFPQTMTEHSVTYTTGDQQNRFKKKKWWMTELMEMREHMDDVTGENNCYLTCKGCSWFTKAVIHNATKVGQHLVRCREISSEDRHRLLQDENLLNYYKGKTLSAGSDLFGIPVTPSISKRRKVTASSRKSFGVGREQVAITKDLETEEIVTAGASKRDREKYLRIQRSKFNELLKKFFVKHMLPFSLLSQKDGSNELYEMIAVANPSIARQLSNPRRMESKNVGRYFSSMRQKAQHSISATLKKSFGTLMFDGWTEGNKKSVLNILLSVPGSEPVRKTYFLKSVYTGSQSCDAAYYAHLVEEAMLEFGEMKRICAVVSDNTSSCVKAKETILEKHNHMISVQDQTHLANLLLEDVGKLPWVKQILEMVANVIVDLRNHPKLYHRFTELKNQYNKQGSSSRTPIGKDQYGRVQLPRSAILPCTMAITRFASSESMIASFLRSKAVFRSLLDCQDFSSNLCGDRNREKRELFRTTVRDDSLYNKVLDIYHISRLIYLRIFDDESSLLSEVYLATVQLLAKVKELPLTPFYTAQRRSQVINVFERRLNGEGRRKALVTPPHRVTYVLDIRSLRESLAPFRSHLVCQVQSFVRSDCFPRTAKLVDEGGEHAAVERICQGFVAVRSSWRSHQQDASLCLSLTMYNRSPVNYWKDYDDSSLLREFALRVLCSSPSSSSVERSSSLQARIRTSTRNRLHQDKVSKLIFCAFNDSLLRSRDRTVRKLSKEDYATFRFGAVGEASPANSGAGEQRGQQYSNFLDDENITSEVVEVEGDMDLEDLDVMRQDFAETSEALEIFSENVTSSESNLADPN